MLIAVENNFMIKKKEKTLFLWSILENTCFHYATRKISPVYKVSTIFEDLSFVSPRSNLKGVAERGLSESIKKSKIRDVVTKIFY